VLRRCVWSRNIKNGCSIYIYDISHLRVKIWFSCIRASQYNSYSENPNKMQQCIKILLFLILNEGQHVSGDTPPIIRSLKLHKQPLVLHAWKVVGRCQVTYATHRLRYLTTSNNCTSDNLPRMQNQRLLLQF